MQNEQLFLKYLFQQEFAKMVAVISKLFGLQHIELAEDLVSETFLQATETWAIKGVPENPTAWLYAVAKQKTLYHFRRHNIFEKKVVPEIIARQDKNQQPVTLDFSQENIRDSQLQMIFAICNPVIASEAQIGLAFVYFAVLVLMKLLKRFYRTKKPSINGCSGPKKNCGQRK